MRKRITQSLLAGSLCAAASLAMAADHRDGPLVLSDPAADINDVFAWMSPDASRVNLVMTVFPGATHSSTFSNAVEYIFTTASQPAYLQPASNDVSIRCTFSALQEIDCNVRGVRVRGDASATTGIESDNGQLRVFAGLRNDPFFFNSSGFRAVAETVTSAASSLSFDDNGCPAVDSGTSNALVTQLSEEPGGAPAIDNFAGQNTLAIVLSVDKNLLIDNGPILSVWGSTERL